MRVSITEVNAYLDHLEMKRRVSPLTVKNYGYTLRAFLRSHRTLTSDAVSAFLAEYENPASANVNLVRLQGLARFLKVSLGDLPRAKEPVKDPEALTSVEVATLLAALPAGSLFADAATVLAHTGLRIHEFRALTPSTLIERDGKTFLVLVGKGKKTRTIPISNGTLAAFRRLDFDRIKTPVFEKLFPVALREAGVKANLPRVHPHLLRASCASILVNEKKIDSATVCRIFGWSKVDTFANHYFRPSLDTLSEAMGD